MWCSRVIGFSEPLASVPHTFRTLMRSRQKVMSALSVLMRLFAFRMVCGEIAPSAANPEPYVRVSPHTAPLCMVIVIDTGLRHL
jgi:hypothetical protein